jgi:hypothetical protein
VAAGRIKGMKKRGFRRRGRRTGEAHVVGVAPGVQHHSAELPALETGSREAAAARSSACATCSRESHRRNRLERVERQRAEQRIPAAICKDAAGEKGEGSWRDGPEAEEGPEESSATAPRELCRAVDVLGA